jgi:hypothetical protein
MSWRAEDTSRGTTGLWRFFSINRNIFADDLCGRFRDVFLVLFVVLLAYVVMLLLDEPSHLVKNSGQCTPPPFSWIVAGRVPAGPHGSRKLRLQNCKIDRFL